ncbi:MAG: IS1634 family transposase [Xenococcus sp. (in: cyanobacteria)]
MTPINAEIQVKNLDHLGLVAGIIDELGIVEIINELLGIQPGEIVSAGVVVKAIILNGLGFVSRPLYLFPQFFQDKATEHLLGLGILPEHLNDDKIGRVMDKLYVKGLSNIFLSITLAAVKKYGISTNYSHLDATSFSVQGKYENNWPEVEVVREGKKDDSSEDESRPQPIKITYGYSRDKRPDLKQFMLDLIVSGDGDIPLFLKTGEGNETDKAVFGKILADFKKQVDFDSIHVADSALYSQDNLLLIKDLKWITRVPLSIKAAQHLVTEITEKELELSSENPGYSFVIKTSNYGGIAQRWLVVESEKRKESDLKKLENKLTKKQVAAQQLMARLARSTFETAAEEKAIIKAENKKLKYYQLNLVKLNKVKDKKSSKYLYQIEATLTENSEIIATEKKRAGRFILATNILEAQKLSADEILRAYREQQAAERGFAFLKDPLFFADSIFLKTAERIETMAMLMGLCLLVYKIGQRQLRGLLSELRTGVKNQLGKLTDRPTLRWIFQCFQGIHVVFINGVKQISNLRTERCLTLSFFPEKCQQYYIFSG